MTCRENREVFNALMEEYREYYDVIYRVFKFQSFEEGEIQNLISDIQNILVKTYNMNVNQLLYLIDRAQQGNNKYRRSYWQIFKSFYQESHQNNVFSTEFQSIIINECKGFFTCNNGKDIQAILNVFEKNTTLYYIMQSDIENLKYNIANNDFDANREYFGKGPLEWASYFGSLECFKYLKSLYSLPISIECLNYSFLGGNKEIIFECLRNITPNENTMEYAIMSHDLDIVIYLQNNFGFEIDPKIVSKYFNLKVLFYKISQREEINRCLFECYPFCLPQLVSYLLRNGADVFATNQDKLTALHIYSWKGFPRLSKVLLDCGADPEANDEDGITPLHMTTFRDSASCVSLLIEYGANPNKKDFYGETPLHFAIKSGSLGVAEMLLEKGADINIKDYYGRTPMHHAVSQGKIPSIDFLIEHGADINSKDNNGRSPIFDAAKFKSHLIITKLVENGCKFDIKDDNGMSPFQLAVEDGNQDVIDAFIEMGVDVDLAMQSVR